DVKIVIQSAVFSWLFTFVVYPYLFAIKQNNCLSFGYVTPTVRYRTPKDYFKFYLFENQTVAKLVLFWHRALYIKQQEDDDYR
ncbi:hypothetical protein QN344_01985, partial [Mucilaginibacter sp. 5B2]|nr:hypothetical protein [Mucilaginibacter sp. 5B2]